MTRAFALCDPECICGCYYRDNRFLLTKAKATEVLYGYKRIHVAFLFTLLHHACRAEK